MRCNSEYSIRCTGSGITAASSNCKWKNVRGKERVREENKTI